MPRDFAWYIAVDETNPQQPQVASPDHAALVLEGSTDGGASWVELDRVTGFDNSWQQRDVALDGKLPLAGTLVLRFTVSNLYPNQFIEAGLDDVTISTLTESCNPNPPPSVTPPAT